MQEDRSHRADLLALEEGVRRSQARPGQAPEGAREGERSLEEARCRRIARQRNPSRGVLGKLLSPAKRRKAVSHVRNALGHDKVSERRACRVLGQPRSTRRRQPQVRSDEPRLLADMVELATQYGRYGYRRITAMLRRDGWIVNHKRVQRLWRREGLKVPSRQPKRRRLWLNDGSCIRLRPRAKDHVWSYDFVSCRTREGRAFRLLTIMDEFTRECWRLR